VLDWGSRPVPMEDNTPAQAEAPAASMEPAADIELKNLPGIVVDDTAALRAGPWLFATRTGERRFGPGYLHDGNNSKGAATITFAPEVPEDGSYAIVLIFPPGANRATNVPVTLTVGGIGSITVRINQQDAENDGQVSLGVYRLPAGRRTRVTVSNQGTDGMVVADAVQLVPAGR
jgi:hypothetical protein